LVIRTITTTERDSAATGFLDITATRIICRRGFHHFSPKIGAALPLLQPHITAICTSEPEHDDPFAELARMAMEVLRLAMVVQAVVEV
jgi:hypothetical protein